MKKFLLSLAVLALGMSAATAQTTVDFSTAEGLPTVDNTTDVTTATIEGIDFSFFNRRVVIIPDSGCLDKWRKVMQQTKSIQYSFYEELEKHPANSDLLDVLFPGE